MNWALLTAMLALPLAFLYGLRPRLTASSRRLAAELAEQRRPEEVQAVLQRALRDPSLELGFPISASEYVGVHGQPLEPPEPGSDRAVTKIGDEIIVHDAALAHQPELDDAIDATRLALERGLSLRSLEATARRESALLDAIPDNVYRTSADGTLLEAHVKGTGAEGSSPPDGRPPDRRGRPARDRGRRHGRHSALDTGEPVTIEYTVEHGRSPAPRGTDRPQRQRRSSGDRARRHGAEAPGAPAGGARGRAGCAQPRRRSGRNRAAAGSGLQRRHRGGCTPVRRNVGGDRAIRDRHGRGRRGLARRGRLRARVRFALPARRRRDRAGAADRSAGEMGLHTRRGRLPAARNGPAARDGRGADPRHRSDVGGGDDVDDLPRLVSARRRGAPGEVHAIACRRTGELRGA